MRPSTIILGSFIVVLGGFIVFLFGGVYGADVIRTAAVRDSQFTRDGKVYSVTYLRDAAQ